MPILAHRYRYVTPLAEGSWFDDPGTALREAVRHGVAYRCPLDGRIYRDVFTELEVVELGWMTMKGEDYARTRRIDPARVGSAGMRPGGGATGGRAAGGSRSA